jgi:CDP-paratose 2-epimerase
MDDVPVQECEHRYQYAGGLAGISEFRPLDFYSPYGCSKGAGDQYVRDYSRIYGLRTVVFRQSCIFGPRQFGVEDQGWVAWFAMRALGGLPVTIFGDGRQVRDVLFVSDLLDAYAAALDRIDEASGEVFNIGGGPSNTLSLLELVRILSVQMGRQIPHEFGDWRPGDQLVYVSDINKARNVLGWTPKVDVASGLKRLIEWMTANSHLFMEKVAMGA